MMMSSINPEGEGAYRIFSWAEVGRIQVGVCTKPEVGEEMKKEHKGKLIAGCLRGWQCQPFPMIT